MTKIATIEYVQRRNALLQQLPIGAVVIVNCASVQIVVFTIYLAWWNHTLH